MTRLAVNKYPDVMGASDWWPEPELQMEYTVPAAPWPYSLLETCRLVPAICLLPCSLLSEGSPAAHTDRNCKSHQTLQHAASLLAAG